MVNYNSTPETATHYHRDNIEDQPIIKMMRAATQHEFRAYLWLTAMKYRERNGAKEGTDDLAKAAQYTEWMQEFMAKGGITLLGTFVKQ